MTYSEPSQTSKMESFAKTVNCLQPLTIFARHSILDFWQGSVYVSARKHNPRDQISFKKNAKNRVSLTSIGVLGELINFFFEDVDYSVLLVLYEQAIVKSIF